MNMENLSPCHCWKAFGDTWPLTPRPITHTNKVINSFFMSFCRIRLSKDKEFFAFIVLFYVILQPI